jgi:hypothetical protein
VSAADPHSRCPDCGFAAPPESMDYALTGPSPGGEIDWTEPVHVRCMICGAAHGIGLADVLEPDSETARRRCAAAVAYRAGAARVQCTGRGLFLLGPDLTEAQREELRIAEGLRGLDTPRARPGGQGTRRWPRRGRTVIATVVHCLTVDMGNLCGVPSTEPGGGRATSAVAEVTCPECLAAICDRCPVPETCPEFGRCTLERAPAAEAGS